MRHDLPLVEAHTLQPYGYFVKNQGSMTYKVMSQASAEFLKLPNAETHVYGIAYNGNVTSVLKTKQVRQSTALNIYNDEMQSIAFEKSIGVENPHGG